MPPDPTLLADRPSTDPEQDLYGHAPFARTLAKAIRDHHGSDGIELALFGPWGSGKSTVLRIMANLLREDEKGPAELAYRAAAQIARAFPNA